MNASDAVWRRPEDIIRNWPIIAQRVERATRILCADSPKRLCVHLRSEAVALVCALHPEEGVMCAACCEAHARRHAVDDEFTCDQCQRMAKRMQTFGVPIWVMTMACEESGRIPFFAGSVFVVGLGVCTACYEGRKR